MKGIVEPRSNLASREGYARGGRGKGLLIFGMLAVMTLALLGDPSSSSAQKQGPLEPKTPPPPVKTTQVWAWGDNSAGELGDGTTTPRNTPVQVKNLINVKDIASGAGFGFHSLALKKDGTVFGWGSNSYGQLGDNSNTPSSSTPVLVKNLANVKSVAGGGNHSLALKDNDGTVWAWGDNQSGQLGDNSNTPSSSTPVLVKNLADVKTMAAGENHSLAVKNNDGTVWAWGDNQSGQLGDGTGVNYPSSTPVQVTDPSDSTGFLTKTKAVAAHSLYSLALKEDGTVWAWGVSPSYGGSSDTPVRVKNLTNVVAIAAGYEHSLALKNDGTVWGWGDNRFGQLGDGLSYRFSPAQVKDSSDSTGFLTNAKAIGAGTYHSLALKDNDGTVWAWGANETGQLGDGTNTYYRRPPAQVKNLGGVTAIAVGSHHSLALK